MNAVPIRPDVNTGAFLSVLGVPLPNHAVFDSFLKLYRNGTDNHTLTIVLKVFLNPLSHANVPLFHVDWDKELFLIKPWPAGAWANFTRAFKKQCTRWSNRFWLKPPNDFSRLDITIAGRTYRPNIYCHLFVDLLAGRAGAHRTIDVVNLDTRFAATKLGTTQARLTSSTFRVGRISVRLAGHQTAHRIVSGPHRARPALPVLHDRPRDRPRTRSATYRGDAPGPVVQNRD